MSLDYLTFDLLLDAGLVHGSFTRQLDCRDEAAHRKIEKELNIPKLAYAHQMHGTNIVEVNSGGKTAHCDALVLSKPNTAVLIKHADCQAAVFYDPVTKLAAAVHSGWRGSVQNIYKAVVEHLQMRHRCKPENLLVGISPSLGPQAAEFRNYRDELPEHFYKFQVAPTYFDFWAISRYQLEATGILSDHIEIAQRCTYSEPNTFFSHRRSKERERLGTVVALLSTHDV